MTKVALPWVLLAWQWIRSENPRSPCRVPMVTEPCLSTLVLGRISLARNHWTILGGRDSTMHTQVTTNISDEQEEPILISGGSGMTRNNHVSFNVSIDIFGNTFMEHK